MPFKRCLKIQASKPTYLDHFDYYAGKCFPLHLRAMLLPHCSSSLLSGLFPTVGQRAHPVFLDLPSLLTQPLESREGCLLYFPSFALFCGLFSGLWRWGLVGPVPACQHALIWMFLFYCVFVCLFVCVCILCSVVYQDGFYGADIYVSIIYWYDIACYTAIFVVSALLLRTCMQAPNPDSYSPVNRKICWLCIFLQIRCMFLYSVKVM